MSATASIWFPLFDTPLTLTLSREQLQCVQDALVGRPEPVPDGASESEVFRVRVGVGDCRGTSPVGGVVGC